MNGFVWTLYKKGKRFVKKSKIVLSGAGKPIRKCVLFESFRGRSYSDNPRAVSEALHRIAPDVGIIWVLNQEDKYGVVPPYVKTVRRDSAEYRKTFSTAAAFVTNEVMESHFPKRKKKQLFVQTWHGDRAFKKILYDVWTDQKRPEPIYDELLTDFSLAGSAYGTMQYRSAFHYNGEIVAVGTPRNDCLIIRDENRVREVRDRLGLKEKQRVLLYAPTMRKENQRTGTDQPIQGIDLRRTLIACENAYGGEWVCLLRAHPIIAGLSGIAADHETIIDATDYPDMADLLLISDCLITDYSSCAGDFALLKRPLFLFQDDIEQYQAKDRAFYFDMNSSPYYAAHSQEELEKLIMSTSSRDAAQNCDRILAFYETTESGHAAEETAKRIADFVHKTGCRGA